MSRKEAFLKTLEETRVVSVIRMHEQTDMTRAMRALYDGGVKIIEITATTPGYLRIITALREHFMDLPDVFVGAGTILNIDSVKAAQVAGADFIVSPVFLPELVETCTERGLCVMPGCMTPTEIYSAWAMGADVIKTFPGAICTPAIYKDLRGPFPSIRMMPTGNVSRQTAPEYIRAGALAVGVGKALAGEDLILSGRYDEITQNANAFCALTRNV